MESNRFLDDRFAMFKNKYQRYYDPAEWEYIEEHFFKDLHRNEIPDLLRQVYSRLRVTASGASYYHKHLRLLKKLFPIDGNIIEIGSGRIPAFAELIANEQRKLNKGSITIYEPLLVELEPKYPNMELHKEYFDSRTDISKADLLVGIMPCEATESILEAAIEHDKDFYVAMCGCVHSDLSGMYMFGYGSSPEIYQDQVINKAYKLLREKGKEDNLEVTKLKNSPIDYPILYSKSEKTLH